MTPFDTFTQLQTHSHQSAQSFHQLYQRLSWLRLLFFVGTISLCWLLYESYLVAAIICGLVGILFFGILLKKHQQVSHKRNLQRALADINHEEIARLSLAFLRPETGENFIPTHHPYCTDLDIFGKHSLFRLLNRAHTQPGMQTLAKWLLAPSDLIEITMRQLAIAELTPQLEWRQSIEATARIEKQVSQSPDFLQNWLQAGENQSIARWRRWRLLPIFSISIIIGAFMGLIPWVVVILLLGFHGYILSKLNASVKLYAEQSQQIVDTFKAYGHILSQIEQQPFKADKLKQLQKQLTSSNQTASASIRQLAQYTENLNFRLNPYFMLAIGLPTLWDLQWMTKLEDWKKVHKHDLETWLATLGEIEALSSLAGYAYAHPELPFAKFDSRPFHFKASQLGHPLLSASKRVSNDFEANHVGQTYLITGSNMSGKSTFLRTVGLNIVMALTGSVVCAKSLDTSLVRVFTSMRTQDSLEENTSSFYAELKRLKALLELTQTGSVPVFYFLDEILKGTNSSDRHRGAEALILQLHQSNASGFVSTHDLELSQMADEHSFVHNHSFYSTFKEGKLLFDYQLQEGACKEFNATALMQQIGIKI